MKNASLSLIILFEIELRLFATLCQGHLTKILLSALSKNLCALLDAKSLLELLVTLYFDDDLLEFLGLKFSNMRHIVIKIREAREHSKDLEFDVFIHFIEIYFRS